MVVSHKFFKALFLGIPFWERAHIPPNGKAGNSSFSNVPWLVGDMMMLVPWKGGFTQIWFDFYGINVGKSTIPMDPIRLSPFDFHSIHLLALYLARLGCPGQEGEDQWVITQIQLMEEIRHPPVEVGSLSCSLQGFFTFQLVQDFFHQQDIYIYICYPPPGDLLFRRCMRRKEQMRYTCCFVKKVRR